MNDIAFKNEDESIMKLLYYFITQKQYSPIIVHGTKNEIWLENLNSEYKVVRIVSNYIHNNEQLDLDIYKTKRVVKKIKQKTFTVKANVLSIFTNLGDNVEIKNYMHTDFIDCIYLKEVEDVKKYDFVIKAFPAIDKIVNLKEKGVELFAKVTKEINKNNETKQVQAEDIFKPKKATVTYVLIGLNILCYIIFNILGLQIGANAKLFMNATNTFEAGEYYRLLTSCFLHADPIHLAFNMYALYLIGKIVEGFYGRWKYLFIYLFAGILGSVLSTLFITSYSLGASGAIFGLFGAILYFGYHYRVYLGTMIKTQIIPILLINLVLGFSLENIDMAGHIGGLVAGVLGALIMGVKYKSGKTERINGIILSVIYIGFLLILNFR